MKSKENINIDLNTHGLLFLNVLVGNSNEPN